MFYKNLPVSGFEPQTSDIGSDRSANWATTTAHFFLLLCAVILSINVPNFLCINLYSIPSVCYGVANVRGPFLRSQCDQISE